MFAYLCRKKRLHQVPVFCSNSQEEDCATAGFDRYFIGKSLYNIKAGRYSGSAVTTIENIEHDR